MIANRAKEANHQNDTLQRSVDSTLATILGREAAIRNGLLTWDEMIKQNKKTQIRYDRPESLITVWARGGNVFLS
ncbi:MAG: hypothetical protein DRP66_03730 [Planctomycetota bacterium]|nr:MAG: hypothetical protein DRP66_03730 [Planctomycetota bacterium]